MENLTMKNKPETALYFTSVVVPDKNMAVLGGHLYTEGVEPSVTRPMVCSGGNWGHLPDVPDLVYATTKKPNPGASRATIGLLGRAGLYREISTGKPAVDTRIDIRRAGFLMDLRYIGTHLYACGFQNQVHVQEGNRWTRSDDGAFAPVGDQVDRSFDCIDGFAEDDIYAAGQGGSIWHWDGVRWSQLESPTNYPFFCLLCSGDGNVYVGGSNGQLFKGRVDLGWTDLSDSGITTKTLEDMTEFKGVIYIAGTRVLLSTTGEKVEAVNVPLEGEKAYYAIDSGPDSMWCVGDDSVLQFDGEIWQRHVCPDNVA
jgi:hypothetical protein